MFESGNPVAILEAYDTRVHYSSPSVGNRTPDVNQVLGQFFNNIQLSLESTEASGRLLINVDSSTVRAISEQEDSSCPIELAAALLLTTGVVRSGMPITTEWQDILDRMTDQGIKSLTRNIQTLESDLSPHVISFFAHQFSTDKPVLAALRRVLEHEPYFWEVQSGEEETKQPQLFDNVWKQILGSHLVIAELTRKNPNVLLEAGIAYGLKNRRMVFLLVEKGQQVFSDLGGHLVFFYDPEDLGSPKEAFDVKFREWLAKQSGLRGYKRKWPFLGYRLLVEAAIITEIERNFLAQKIGDPRSFLSDSPENLRKATGIQMKSLVKAREYLTNRINLHKV